MNEESQQERAAPWTPPAPRHLEAMLPQYDEWIMIGCGGMGAVYKARQISLDRPVAIKVLPPQVAEGDAEYIQRFKNEARTMARMNHPAIVAVYDFGTTRDELLYIVMEYIDGTDVAKMIQAQGKLPMEHALAITAHVCDALAYAHEHGVIHRDIKPANILINMEGAVKVADFGLSSVYDPAQGSVTQEGTTLGTPDYVAPEVLIVGMSVDGRADVYAVGVMLYNMLTGRIPRGSFQMASEKVGCDPRYDAIIAKAMEHDLARRYQTARKIRQDLDQILTVPVAKEQPARKAIHGGMMPRLPPPPPPPPPTPWGMIAAGLIVLLGAVLFLMQVGRNPEAAPAPAQASEATPESGSSPPTVADSASPQPKPPPPPALPPVPVDPDAPKGSPFSALPVLGHSGHYYQVVGEQMNQANAQQHAQSLGAHLATINSQEEQDWMDSTLPPYLKQVPQSMATIGGIRDKGGWKWLTIEPFDFTHWADPATPPNDPGKRTALKITAKPSGKVEWGLGSPDSRRAFVIEWDATSPKPPAQNAPPSPMAESEGMKRLRELDASFRAALERDVLAVHRTALESLNTKYIAALDRALSAATAAARLSEALALREEQQRVTGRNPLPAEDAPDLPSALKFLRSTYRTSLRPIDSARDSSLSALFVKYEGVLKAAQTEWTQAGKPDDARLAVEKIAALPRERVSLLNEAQELPPSGR